METKDGLYLSGLALITLAACLSMALTLGAYAPLLDYLGV